MNRQVIQIENKTYFTLVEQRLDAGEQVWIPVRGGSMLPFLRERDEVLLQPAGMKEVGVGDIVLARWEGRHVVHRVVRKKVDELWLAGDHNLVQIEKVRPAEVLAVLIDARRNKRRLPVATRLYTTLGMCWYALRLPRRIVVAVKRRIFGTSR